MKGPSTGFMTVKTLVGFDEWPAKHRHWSFDVLEDESHDIWINTSHLRAFYAALPSDKQLRSLYGRTMIYAKDVKAYFITERAMRMELRKGMRSQAATDALKFLDWFERNVTAVAAKKRASRKIEERYDLKLEHLEKVLLGPIPGALAPSNLEASTMPYTSQEVWRLEAAESVVPKVYHPEARVISMSWSNWAKEHLSNLLDWLASFWRGERRFLELFVLAYMLSYIPRWVLNEWIPDALDWTKEFGRVLWGFAAIVPVAMTWSIWFAVSLWRHTKSAFELPGGHIWASVVFILAIPIAPGYFFKYYDQEMLEPWWEMVSGRYHPAEVEASPHLGRIVVRGQLRFGSAEALAAVLQRNPKMTLVQVESPGGYVIEGLRMADMILKSQRDTVSLEKCFSACTLLLAAGQERYLGPDARIGFHRSGTKYGPVEDGWNEVDHEIADFWKQRGVKDAFIDQALTPSIRQLWVAPHADMYSANYATLRWSERKTGY